MTITEVEEIVWPHRVFQSRVDHAYICVDCDLRIPVGPPLELLKVALSRGCISFGRW